VPASLPAPYPMNSLIEDAAGGASTLRVCVLAAVAAGLATIACGLVGFFRQLPESMLVIGSGQGLITLVLTLKVWQRTVEEKGAKGE
jgi:hypothetical protein